VGFNVSSIGGLSVMLSTPQWDRLILLDTARPLFAGACERLHE
jgi:hypothetical protein